MPFHNFQPKFLSGHPSWGPAKKIRPNLHPNFPHGIYLEISNQKNFRIAQLESIPKFPSNHPWVAPSSYPVPARAKFYHAPPASHFTYSYQENILQHNQSTTHLNFSSIHILLAPSRLRLTHGLYQAAFAAPRVTLYLYSRLDPTFGSSTGRKSRVQS